MNISALFTLSYGLYIIGTKDGSHNVGCVVNTVTQSTAQPITLTVCIHKDNHTNACIRQTQAFSVSILAENAPPSIFGTFGFASSRDKDKFAEFPTATTPGGLPYITEGTSAFLECKVINEIDNHTHTIFIAEITEAETLPSDAPPMTYSYYHNVIKGKTAKNASTYVAETAKPTPTNLETHICQICKYEHIAEKGIFAALPETYTCPICGVPKNLFKPQA